MSRLLIISLVFLCGCTSIKTDAWCEPIFISKDDILTEGTAKDIATHNETWETNTR